MPFLDTSNEFVGPVDWLRIMRPLEEVTTDTGNDVDGGCVTDLGDGATTIVKVRGDFSKTPPFMSDILDIDGGDDVGDNDVGPRGAKGESVHRPL